MALLKCIIILMLAVSGTLPLLVWRKYPDEKPGKCALPDGRIIKVGIHVDHEEMCADYLCWAEDGTTAISYCQITVPFQECNETGVMTYHYYPECCYMCTAYIDC
ncbi:uncharacterized protein DMAD_03520 [Drosophila madeirensis]|uniref:Single domain-containing protein n=1 Tax=Drosophila madeirensis TaxID=30013 RepID=A0AAU9GAE5_DROMD